MGKVNNTKMIGGILIAVAVVIIVVVVIVNLTSGSTTGDVIIKGSGTMTGLKCTDTTLEHPVFRDSQSSAWTNVVTANFVDDKLSSVMYRYDGTYQSENEAELAKVRAEADYNLILANEYGEKIDIFTHTFMGDGDKVALTITGDADKVTSKTAPYFLLESTSGFPKTLDELMAAYEAKGFSCAVENEN